MNSTLHQLTDRRQWIIVLLATATGLALAVGVLGLFAALPAVDAGQPRTVYRVVATIPLPTGIGDNPRDVAVNPTTGTVYVANESMGTLSVLSGTQFVATIPLTHHPYALAVNPATGYVYVTHTRGPRPDSLGLTIVQGMDVVAVLPEGVVDSEVVVNHATGYVYLNAGGGETAVISGIEVIGHIPFRSGARAFATNPRTGYVYAIDSANDSVAIISGTEQITNIPVGDTPLDLDLDPTTGLVYVANANSDSVSILRDTQVITTVTVGGKPHDITVNATTGYVYVLNGASRDVSVLHGTDLVGTILSDLGGRIISKLESGPAEYSYALISNGGWETRYTAATLSGLPATGSEEFSTIADTNEHTYLDP